MANKQPRWPDWLRALVLLVSGFVGIGIFFLNLLGFDSVLGLLNDRDLAYVLLGVVGVVALSFGVEHIVEFHRWTGQLDEVGRQLRDAHADVRDLIIRLGGGHPIPGEANVFKSLENLLSEAKYDIRGLTLGQTPRAQADWVELVIEKLQDTSAAVSFRSVYGVDFDNVPDSFWEDLEYRRQRHQAAGVEERFSFFFLNERTHIGFDILIIDSKHIMIGIYSANNKTYRGGVLFTDRAAVAGHFANWFDDNVLVRALTYQEFVDKLGASRVIPGEKPPKAHGVGSEEVH